MDAYPGGSKAERDFSIYVHTKFMESLQICKSKEEAAKHLWDHYKISPAFTEIVWDNFATSENNRSICERQALMMAPPAQVNALPSQAPEQVSEIATRSRFRWLTAKRAREQQEQQRRFMETAQNLQRDASASSQVPQEAASANDRNPRILEEENSSNSKRQRLGKEQERGDNEEAENLHH